MATRNLCFARGQAPGAAQTIVYTVPAGFHLLFKSAAFQDTSGQTGTSTLVVIPAGQASGVVVMAAQAVTTPVRVADFWIALNEGDMIRLNAGINAVNYWLSGALLPLQDF